MHRHFDDVAGLRTHVHEVVVDVQQHRSDDAALLAQVALERLQLAVDAVDLPDPQVQRAASDQLVAVVVEKRHTQRLVVGSRAAADGSAGLDVPDHQVVVVLPAQRCQELFVGTEGEALHLDLVKVEAMHDLTGLEVPHDGVGLEPHVGHLAGGHIATTWRHSNAGHGVRVAAQEALRLRARHIADNHSRSQRVENKFVGRVDHEPPGHVARESNHRLEVDVLHSACCPQASPRSSSRAF